MNHSLTYHVQCRNCDGSDRFFFNPTTKQWLSFNNTEISLHTLMAQTAYNTEAEAKAAIDGMNAHDLVGLDLKTLSISAFTRPAEDEEQPKVQPPKVFILPNDYAGDPEATAMLQAFYSRSLQGIEERLANLGTDLTKVKRALNTYFVGYGHKSIGDCGTITLFIEGVSMIAAKALQHDSLYDGQESSTRYIDFAATGFQDVHNKDIAKIQSAWLNIYLKALAEVAAFLLVRWPLENHGIEPTPVQAKAIKARAFDICRSLLPAGAKTNLSLHVSLRKVSEIAGRLSNHPSVEVRVMAAAILKAANERYPHAVPDVETDPHHPQAYYDHFDIAPDVVIGTASVQSVVESEVRDTVALYWRDFLAVREKYAPVPRAAGIDVDFRISAVLDFGSYRDIQRHRNGYMSMPLLSTRLGFHSWYMNELAAMLSNELFAAIIEMLNVTQDICTNMHNQVDAQLAIPMGFQVAFMARWGLDQAVYVSELRSGTTVHPTCRSFATELAAKLDSFGYPTHANMDTDNAIDERRGKQDIVKQ